MITSKRGREAAEKIEKPDVASNEPIDYFFDYNITVPVPPMSDDDLDDYYGGMPAGIPLKSSNIDRP